MKRLEFTSLLFLLGFQIFAQTPDWVDFEKRKFYYPDDVFLSGYYSAPNDKSKPEEKQIQELLGYAKTDIIENISVSIQSISTLETEQAGRSFNQVFSQQSVASARSELTGLKTEVWKDTKKKELHVFAYVTRSGLIDFYKSKIDGLVKKIESDLTIAVQLKTESKKEMALAQYYLCKQTLFNTEIAASILLGLQKFYNYQQLVVLSSKINSGIESIISTSPTSPDEAALLIAESIKQQLNEKQIICKLFAPTYQDSKLTSSFSHYMLKSLESKLASRGIGIETASTAKVENIISGTYWFESDKIKIIITLSNVNNGKIIATAESFTPLNWFEANKMACKPENFEDAFSRMKAFSKDEIIGGGLHLDLWTNKGDENLIFHENDTLILYVRVNHECYLRFIYYMADGSKVLLLNDYYISSDKVNQVIQIPDHFVCAEPFGIESLVLNGQTEVFPKLNTNFHDGYNFIEDHVSLVVAQTRGFKKVNNKMFNGEKRLNFTTLRK